jgi:hypothetical protein
VLGIAVLASIFTSHGGYASPHAFISGLKPALWIGTAVLGAGAILPLVLPFSTRQSALAHAAQEAAETAPMATEPPPVTVAVA